MPPSEDAQDLLAMAVVRRLLLEMNHEVSPEALCNEPEHVGTLELWLHAPHADLEGLSPLQALGRPDGESRVQALLARLVARRDEARRGPEQPPA